MVGGGGLCSYGGGGLGLGPAGRQYHPFGAAKPGSGGAVGVGPVCSGRAGEEGENARRELERCRRRGISQEKVSREHVLRYTLEILEDQLHVY